MIYICIPSHNEEQTVGVVLWKIRQVMANFPRDYQLLVADDASTDRTAQVLDPYTRVLPLTVMRNAERRGFAASLEMLLREAVRRSDYEKRDSIVVLQADFTDDPSDIEALARKLESGADIVAGNRARAGGGMPRKERWARGALHYLVRAMGWAEGVTDPLGGFNAYRLFCVKAALEACRGDRLLTWEGRAANAQLLRAAAPHARRIDAVDVVNRPERRQRETRFRFRPLLREIWGFRRGAKPPARVTVEELRPDAIMGGRARQRALLAENLRQVGVKRADAPSDGRRGRRSGSASGVSPGTRRRRQDREATGDAREAPAPDDRAQPAGTDATAPAGATDTPEARPRRPRRRGRRGSGRKSAPGRETQNGDAAEAEAGTASATSPNATLEANGKDPRETSEPGSESNGARRRGSGRRGRRGGRRRGATKPVPPSTSEDPGARTDPSGPSGQ